MKNPIKNMHKKIDGLVFCGSQLIPLKLDVIITNDKLGKTLSVGDGKIQYTFAFEQIERYLKWKQQIPTKRRPVTVAGTGGKRKQAAT